MTTSNLRYTRMVEALNELIPINTTTIKAALYYESPAIDVAQDTYTTTGEFSGDNYTAGGVPVSIGVSAYSSSEGQGTATWSWTGKIIFSDINITSNVTQILLYDTARSNRTIYLIRISPPAISAHTTISIGELTRTSLSDTALYIYTPA